MIDINNMPIDLQELISDLDKIEETLKQLYPEKEKQESNLKRVVSAEEYNSIRNKYKKLIYEEADFVNRNIDIVPVELLKKVHERRLEVIEKYKDLIDNSIRP